MDAFTNMADQPAAPASSARAVVPSDTDALADVPKALFVGTGGTLTLRGADGADATFRNVPSGSVLPFRARMVRATGTDAADIVALY